MWTEYHAYVNGFLGWASLKVMSNFWFELVLSELKWILIMDISNNVHYVIRTGVNSCRNYDVNTYFILVFAD